MRISGFDNDLGQSRLLGVDPKVAVLLENISRQPLLIEKLTLNEAQGFLLHLDKSSPFSLIQLPIQNAKILAPLNQNEYTVQLELKGNQLEIEFIQREQLMTDIKSNFKLLFNQAQLVEKSILKLNQPVNTAIKNETSLQSPITQAPVLNQANSQQLTHAAVTTKTDPLAEAIEQFLASKPREQQPLANTLNSLLGKQQKLFESINSNQMGHSTFNLSRTAIMELLTNLSDTSNKDSVYQSLKQLFQIIQQLQNSLDFSKTNRQLDIGKRFADSGNFLESRLIKASGSMPLPQSTATKQSTDVYSEKTTIPTKQRDAALLSSPAGKISTSSEVGSEVAKDVKFYALQINQALQKLTENLALPGARAISSDRLLNLIVRQFVLSDLTSRSDTTKSLPSFIIDDKEPTLLEKIERAFQAPDLQRLSWSTLLQNESKTPVLNQTQENALLSLQRSILNEMRHEVNAFMSKIETNQLLSLRHESAQLQQFLVDLPIHRGGHLDSFELLFENREKTSEKKPSKTWTVTVRFDLQPLGPMFAKVTLKDQRISSHFYARDKTTAKLLTDNLQHLKDSLAAAGVRFDEIAGQQGIVPTELIRNDAKRVDVKV